MSKLLITGGTGFIGTYVCQECERQRIDYLALGRTGKSCVTAAKSAVVDLLDKRALEKIVANFCPDAIIHLAGVASPVYENNAQIYAVNICGTENLLKAAAAMKNPPKMLLISTAGVYGNQKERLIKETVPYNPINHYSYSKMVVEFLSRQYKDRIEINIVRPFNIIGSGQSTNFLIPKLVRAFGRKEPVLQLGNVRSVRDYVSVEFCAKLLTDMAVRQKQNPDVVNICSGVGLSCLDICAYLEQLTDHHPQIEVSKSFVRSNEIWRLVGDPEIMNTVLAGRYASPACKTILANMLARIE